MKDNTLNQYSVKKYWKGQNPPNLEELKRNNQNFVDSYFPPNINSLTSKNDKGQFVDSLLGQKKLNELEEENPGFQVRLTWKRVTEINKEWKIFSEAIEFNDVIQGRIGDCYYLSAISALTEYPYLIKQKFRTQNANPEGYYEMIFFIDGEWQIVFVDDYFPFDPSKKNWAFCCPNGAELWSMLLEKAWAKVNGGYSNSTGGLVSEALTALTGFPSCIIINDDIETEKLYEKIEKCDEKGIIMSCGSKNDEAIIKGKGLVQSHAYTLIGAKKWEERGLYLLHLRNPWGTMEWNGDWSDKSNLWTDEYKKYFKYSDKDEGIFWINIEDFIEHFNTTYICRILYGSIIKNFYFEYKSYLENPAVFNFYLNEESRVSICAFFKGWRFNRDIHEVIHPFAMVLAKYDKDRKIEKLSSNWSSQDDVTLIKKLTPGYYCLWMYCPFDEVQNDYNFKYTLQISSQSPIKIEFIGLDKSFLLIQYLLLENFKITGAENINSSKDYFLGSDRNITSGISNILIYNKSDKVLEICASEKEVFNVEILPPYKGLNNIKIKIPPKESSAIIGVRLSNEAYNVDYNYKIYLYQDDSCNVIKTNEQKNSLNNFLKLDISENINPEFEGLRSGEYKYVEKRRAKETPLFNKNKFLGEQNLKSFAENTTEMTPESLATEYPNEINYLLKQFPQDLNPNVDKKWCKLIGKSGTYLGQIDIDTGNINGRGVFIWKKGKRYIGYWKDGIMNGKGILLSKELKLLYCGDFDNGKRHGKGVLKMKNEEYYDGEFATDKMDGYGDYYYLNGDIYEGQFKNNMKEGIGLLFKGDSQDIYLTQHENDNYMGGSKLSEEEKAKILELRQKKLLKDSKKDLENQNKEYITQEERQQIEKIKEEAKSKLSAIILQKKQEEYEKEKKTEKERELDEIERKKLEEEKIKKKGVKGFKKLLSDNLVNYEENKIKEKSKIITLVTVEGMMNSFEETEDVKKHRLFIENIIKYQKEEPFMIEKFLAIRPLFNLEEDIQFFNQTNFKYLGGIGPSNDNPNKYVRKGRGVLFDGKTYYAGYWENDKPNGYFCQYNSKKQITFKGFLDENYGINCAYVSTLYYGNGEWYKGHFLNNKMNGFGTFYFVNGDSWSGEFVNNQFNGTGKYFLEDGYLLQTVTYKNNNVVSKENLRREDHSDPNAFKFFDEIDKKYPGVIEKLLLLPALRTIEGELVWTTKKMNDGSIYIGQSNKKKQFNGRGCFIYKKSNKNPIRYYIGYIRGNLLYSDGTYYDEKWNILFEGKFENDIKNGFGISKENDGSIYVGDYINGIPHGFGVYYYPNGSRFEGSFIRGERNDKGYYISSDLVSKQEIEYDKGNVVKQGEIINYKKGKCKSQLVKDLEEFEKKCKSMGYGDYFDLFNNLSPTKDTLVLTKDIKEDASGVYIGELNSIGFKHGRGILLSNHTKSFYVGYFENNEKNGKGTDYFEQGYPKYIGEYRRNKRIGRGDLYFKNGELIQGTFNVAGEGKGVYYFADGSYWNGQFYAWSLNGVGEYFNKDEVSLGYQIFQFNKHVTK